MTDAKPFIEIGAKHGCKGHIAHPAYKLWFRLAGSNSRNILDRGIGKGIIQRKHWLPGEHFSEYLRIAVRRSFSLVQLIRKRRHSAFVVEKRGGEFFRKRDDPCDANALPEWFAEVAIRPITAAAWT